jgi:hypothetical protein
LACVNDALDKIHESPADEDDHEPIGGVLKGSLRASDVFRTSGSNEIIHPRSHIHEHRDGNDNLKKATTDNIEKALKRVDTERIFDLIG